MKGNFQRAETTRMFFAIRVPEKYFPELADLQGKLRGDWRSVSPMQFHLTMVFLPHVLPSEMEIVRKAGMEAASVISKFPIKLSKTSCFPNTKNPRVFVIHAESPSLEVLANEIRQRLGNVDHDVKPFRGHVTIARAKSPSVKLYEADLNIEWLAEEVELVQSVLGGKGPDHTVLERFVFGSKV